MDEEIRAAFAASGGILSRREHRVLARRLDGLLSRGVIASPLPGVFAAGPVQTWAVKIMAGARWLGPDCVVCGAAAATLTFWPSCPVAEVEQSVSIRARTSRPGWVVSQRRLPEELLWDRGTFRLTSPALTAVDLAAGPAGGDAIDQVRRTRTGTLEQMWRALELTPARPGNRVRAELLHDSRDQPWSEAERELHRMLRGSGIAGWTTNA